MISAMFPIGRVQLKFTKPSAKESASFIGLILVGVSVFLVGVFLSYYALSVYNFSWPPRFDKEGLPRAYVIQSGSMEPAIKTASVVVSIPANSYRQGDIITYAKNGNTENLVTHRIEAKMFPGGVSEDPTYLTSGDANEDIDQGEVAESAVVGRVAFSVPYFGHLVGFAQQPQGFILFVIIPATIIVYEELKSLKSEVGKKTKYSRARFWRKKNNKGINFLTKKEKFGLPKPAILLPVVGSLIVLVGVAGAFFSDLEISSGTINIEAPSPVSSSEAGQSTIYLNQLGTDDQYGYPHDYTSAADNNVSFTFDSPAASTLTGTLAATGLKPYVTYQAKFAGIPTCMDAGGNDTANEYVGYKGRWTCVSANCAGQTAAQRNRSDTQYEANKLLLNSNPAKECIQGYLVWDYLNADSTGNANKSLTTTNSYHVLRCGGGTCGTIDDSYLAFLDAGNPTLNLCPADKVNGELEPGRSACDSMTLDSGTYNLQMLLTEESFHQGNWATVLYGDIDFTII